MKATFLVSMNLAADEDLMSIANRIENALINEMPVTSVTPWARPKTAPSAKANIVMSAFKTIPR